MENDVNISCQIPASYRDGLENFAKKKFGPDGTLGHALRDIISSALDLPPVQKIYRSQAEIKRERAENRRMTWECYQRLGSYKAASLELGRSISSIERACSRYLRDQRIAFA